MPLNLSSIDNRAITVCRIELGEKSRKSIDFQFPPRILSESKSGNWKSTNVEHTSYEPVVTYRGANSRELTVDFEYVVYADWTVSRIANNVRKVKEYYYNPDLRPLDAPAVYLYIFDVAPEGMSFRMINVGIKYSEEIVAAKGDWIGWPLHTKVSMQLQMWTNAFPREAASNEKTESLIEHLTPFNPSSDMKWY